MFSALNTMKSKFHPALRQLVAIGLACVGILSGQVTPEHPTDTAVTEVPVDVVVAESINIASQQTTTLEFGYWGVKGTLAPHEPIPATFVPASSKLVLKLSDALGSVSNVQWFRNNEPLSSGSRELEISETANSDSGFYWATFSGNPETPSTSSLQVVVADADHHRLGNMSVRATVTTGSPTATFGFVVAQQGAYPYSYGQYLIRVIGPTLEQFQVPNALPDPVVRFFNAAGDEFFFVTTAIFQPGYYDWLNTLADSVGAFPVDLPSATEFVMFVQLPAGAYTAQVSSASGNVGDVLFELYEVLEAPPFPENQAVETPL